MIRTIGWRRDHVVMIDQRLLPTQEVYRVYRDYREVAAAIREMVIRGAPAIGVAAAMGVALGVLRLKGRNLDDGFDRVCATLEAARPTAVNLRWAISRMRSVFVASRRLPLEDLRARLIHEAKAIQREDIEVNQRLGRLGAELLPDSGTVLTYCNAGALATAGYGTAVGIVRAARASGKDISVITCETRPYLQGSRLTAWELKKERIPFTLVTDNAVGAVMQRGLVKAVVVGTDRTAANGDVANKIGTYGVAVLAARHRVPFYVAAPCSSIDLGCATGDDIPIEERSPDEVTTFAGIRVAPKGTAVFNPAFDVTPAKLVTAIVTERGVARPPYGKVLRGLLVGATTADRKATRRSAK
jgi:methylthioribose-1-phosphate isomerase